MFANHVVTRSRESGRVDGYERAGVEYLQIRAVLDHRTSCICRNLHGRIIEVDKARRLRARLMDAKSPEDVKEIAPWVPCDGVKGKRSSELPEHLALPPYHFGCRTRTVVWKPPESRVEEKVMGSAISEEDRAILDQYTEEEYASWIDDIRRRARRLRWNEKDLKEDIRKHGKEFGLSDPDAYAHLARRAIEDAQAWSAHVYKGELQFRIFSNKGVVVVDQHMRIRGFYNPGDIGKAFDGYKRRSLWLKLSRSPRPGSS